MFLGMYRIPKREKICIHIKSQQKIPNDRKLYIMFTKCAKWPYLNTKVTTPRPPKYIIIWILV
jgi:hypothetical protein